LSLYLVVLSTNLIDTTIIPSKSPEVKSWHAQRVCQEKINTLPFQKIVRSHEISRVQLPTNFRQKKNPLPKQGVFS